MNEFVECQNCGRRFFAENLDCPYCGGEPDEDDTAEMVADLMRTVAPSTKVQAARPARGIFDVLYAGFSIVAVAIAVWSAVLLVRAPNATARFVLGAEVVLGIVIAIGVTARKHWARPAAIAFIAGNVVLGIASALAAGRPFAILGGGPAALLLFAWPFFGAQARERFRRR